ncbi:MAG: hypothetical protein JXR94_16700, partial [Candidatus Hydrogenedentes bacterium]|nr:hypothetical protein [Candidatus Hydrogenedentota bacterium]
MRRAVVVTILRKELLDTLRDKRTLVAMFVIPVVLYPGLFVIGSQVALSQQDSLEKATCFVALQPGNPILADWIAAIPG